MAKVKLILPWGKTKTLITSPHPSSLLFYDSGLTFLLIGTIFHAQEMHHSLRTEEMCLTTQVGSKVFSKILLQKFLPHLNVVCNILQKESIDAMALLPWCFNKTSCAVLCYQHPFTMTWILPKLFHFFPTLWDCYQMINGLCLVS